MHNGPFLSKGSEGGGIRVKLGEIKLCNNIIYILHRTLSGEDNMGWTRNTHSRNDQRNFGRKGKVERPLQKHKLKWKNNIFHTIIIHNLQNLQ
jgi:hypothetical protein